MTLSQPANRPTDAPSNDGITVRATAPEAQASIVSAILGAHSVKLQGFKAEPVALPWIRVDAPHVSLADGSTDEVHAGFRRRNRTLTALASLGAFLALLATGAAGFIFGQGSVPTPAPSSSLPAQLANGRLEWKVTSIAADSLRLDIGGVPLRVRPGEPLPNGEVLSATHPAQQAYVTNRSTVLVSGLKSAPTQAAPATSMATAGDAVKPTQPNNTGHATTRTR